LMPKYVWLNPQTGQDEYVAIDVIKDERRIIIYKDHLARDTANFLPNNECKGHVELPNGLFVTVPGGEGGISCIMAASHAYNGTISKPWDQWVKSPSLLRGDARITQWVGCLERGDIISYGLGATPSGHWETFLGEHAITYAADTASGIFRRDTVLTYYDTNNMQSVMFYKRPGNEKVPSYKE
ncbi:MAG TPA: hypothetical protein PL033_18845, partial [Candidatus Brocadiia bacterium]|nr:hypothetical protein [Candidatus Brocadiia bacterium]